MKWNNPFILLLILLFTSWSISPAFGQGLQGYLGKKQNVQLSLDVVPSLANPNILTRGNSSFNPGINLKLGVHYGYVLQDHFMVVGKLSYSNTYVSEVMMGFDYAVDNEGSGGLIYPENPASLSLIEIGAQGRWYTEYLAPVGIHVGVGVSYIQGIMNGEGMDYPSPMNRKDLYNYEEELITFGTPKVVLEMGVSRVFSHKYFLDIGLEVGGVVAEVGRVRTLFSKTEDTYPTHKETLVAAAKGRVIMHELFMSHIGFGIIF